ncbi:MAG: uracil phosphoribosyltransferase [Thermomonas hydrothermalis]|uniref:uracil phosphoribosyltransferase n=1 Tax=Thermomonas hydrothermalis TaxID=213588 RepID=UPI00235410D0|nr:uracil phosphoribosyltransferase [Thermomonas hydrothermalis]MCL6618251.1 uracil phosphoribosyltransferase [Thermomonas hydrothermalis]
MKTVVVDHPLVRHKLGKLRDIQTDPVHFRQIAGEVASLLAYEATRDLPTEPITVQTWAGPLSVEHVRGEALTLVPILRAGLGFLPGVQALLPAAPVSVIGLRRNEATHRPEGYYQRLADRMDERIALLIDPMLATGGSAIAAIGMLKQAGCRRIKCLFLVAAPEGLAALEAAHPDIEVFVAAIDERLDENAYIRPGLGDAGDRLFGTPVD